MERPGRKASGVTFSIVAVCPDRERQVLCIGIVMLLGFVIVFAVEMHQDSGRVPYDERHLKEDIPFDPQGQEAVIRVSACTGEKIAGFRSRKDGSFTEVMVLRSAEEEKRFLRAYGLTGARVEYGIHDA